MNDPVVPVIGIFADDLTGALDAATPPDVRVTTVDDDGRVVAVDTEAAEYSTLLGFIGVLNEVPQFAPYKF